MKNTVNLPGRMFAGVQNLLAAKEIIAATINGSRDCFFSYMAS